MRPKLGLLAAVATAAAALLTPGIAHAAPCTYIGPNNGSWDSTGNWSCAAIPGASDDVTLSTNAVLISTTDESVHSLTMGTSTTVAFANSHVLTVGGLTTFNGTDGNRATIDGAGTLSVGAVTWTSGDVCVSNGATLSVAGALTFPAGVGTLPCNTGGSKIVVASGGSLVQTGGTRTVASAVEVDGSLEVQAGSLQLAAGVNTDEGSLTADSGTTLKINGNRTLGSTGSIGGAGLVDVSAGFLTVPSTATLNPTSLQIESAVTANGTPALVIPTLTLNGGTLDGTRNRTIHTLTAHNGILGGANTTLIDTAFSTDGPNQLQFDVTSATTTVAPSWTGVGDICVSNGGILQLNATLTVGGSTGSFPCNSGGSKVVVASGGSIVRSGAGTSTFATPVEVSGSGLVNLGSGQTLNFNGGLTLLTGGKLAGAGTVGGTVTNTSGVVSPGSSPGTLTIGGNYSQGSGGTLAIDVVSSGSVDKLVVGGSATLDGTLAVTDSNLSGPGPYQILSSGSARSGTFSSVTFTFAAHPYTVAYNPNDVTLTNGPPTAVRVLSFMARRSLVGVEICWRTAQETAVLGFNVYRDGVRVNRRLIASRGGAAGATYRVRDLRAGHRYRLQVVRTDGRRSWIASAHA